MLKPATLYTKSPATRDAWADLIDDIEEDLQNLCLIFNN